MADVIGYHAHRDRSRRRSARNSRRRGPPRTSDPAGRPESRWDRPGRPSWPVARRARRGLRHRRVPGTAPVHLRCHPLDAVRRGGPPHLAVPWLNIYDTRDFLSFLAEPLFRRVDGLASVVDLRVHSGKDFPQLPQRVLGTRPGVGRHRHSVHLERTEPLTVREARALGFEARRRPAS